MLNFLGENYYIDVNELEDQVSLINSKYYTPPLSGETENEQQISVTRYETFKSLIEVILTEREELDENLGIHSAKNLTIPFKIAFNTLLMNKIIKTL
jgi:transcription termination factor NusB